LYRATVNDPVGKLPAIFGELPDRAGSPEARVRVAEEVHELLPLQERIGYSFVRPALLRAALTLGSWSNEHPHSGWPGNGCLEFLGDAVLGLLAADALWKRFPSLDEGRLTRLRASVVSERALAAIASEIDLGQWLFLGRGDLKQGGRQHRAILADTVEAVLGAVYLDAMEAGNPPVSAARKAFSKMFGERLAGLRPEHGLHPKSRLQQWAQAHYRITPSYVRVGDSPPPGEPRWTARVELRRSEDDIEVLGEGEGRSLREAERAAAEQALERIGAPTAVSSGSPPSAK